jgi:hypothetical protein
MEVGKPRVSLLPLKSKLPLHPIIKLLFISIIILLAYRMSLLGRYLSGLIVLSILLDRPIVLGLFLAVLYVTVILYLTQREERWRLVSILMNDKDDREADYFIRTEANKVDEAIQNVKDLMFYLYNPTVFFLIVNSQLDNEWGEFTKGVLRGTPSERGVCDIFTNYALLITPTDSLDNAVHLFPKGERVFLIKYSPEKFRNDEAARSSLTQVLIKLAHFTHESRSYASEEFSGAYAFDPATFNEEIEEGYSLVPCYPFIEFPLSGYGVAEIIEKMLLTQSFSSFSLQNIRQVFVFDIVEKGELEEKAKIELRNSNIRAGVHIALGNNEVNVAFKLLEGGRKGPPLVFLVKS